MKKVNIIIEHIQHWVQENRFGFTVSCGLHLAMLILLSFNFITTHSSGAHSSSAKASQPQPVITQAVMIKAENVEKLKQKIEREEQQKQSQKNALTKELEAIKKAKAKEKTEMEKLKKQKQSSVQAHQEELNKIKNEMEKIKQLKTQSEQEISDLKKKAQTAKSEADVAQKKLEELAKKKLENKVVEEKTVDANDSKSNKKDTSSVSSNAMDRETIEGILQSAFSKNYYPTPEHAENNPQTIVKIIFSGNGKLVSVTIDTSSGDSSHDKIALNAVNKTFPLANDYLDRMVKVGLKVEKDNYSIKMYVSPEAFGYS